MKAKNYSLKALKISEIISIVIILLLIAYSFSCKLISVSETDIQESYQKRIDNCLLLQTIATDCIEEGNGININSIPSDTVKYKIYTKDNDIVFYYSLKDASSYEATITLSNDYKILDENYSVELEDLKDYDAYKLDLQLAYIASRCILTLFFTSAICLIAFAFYCLFKPHITRKR